MYIILPPSETKATGGTGAPLDLSALAFPSLHSGRTELVGRLTRLARSGPATAKALGVSQRQLEAVMRTNLSLETQATLPAVLRYTGVLYDALAAATWLSAGAGDPVAGGPAAERLLIGSALFGLLRATDPIPAYRLSAGSSLPQLTTLRSFWRQPLTHALAPLGKELVLDLRSGAYAQLGAAPAGHLTVKVVTESPGGERKVVSHFNKAYKGQLARYLLTEELHPTTAGELQEALGAGGFRVEPGAQGQVVVVVTA